MQKKSIYFKVDHELNTYISAAAQPRPTEEKKLSLSHLEEKYKNITTLIEPGIERKIALTRLKEHIAYGTLIKEETPQAPLSPLLTGSDLLNQSLFFEEYIQPDNANYLFILLETSRIELTTYLLAFKTIDEFRTRIAPEILEKFISQQLSIPKEIENLFQTYLEKCQYFDTVITQIKLEIDIPSNILNSLETNGATQLLEYLKGFPENDPTKILSYGILYQMLFAASSECKTSYQQILNYCSLPEIYEFYFNTIKIAELCPGNRTALLFSEIKNKTLYIWKKPGYDPTLNLVDSFVSNSQFVTHLLVNEKSICGFSVLGNINTENSTSPELMRSNFKLTIDYNHINQVNMYQDNLLHRAVRSPAADLLVPYLLNESNFKSKINERNVYGKTALHRAIRYCAEFRDKISKELEGTNTTYLQFIETLFTELLKAGAKLDIQENHGSLTPLDRARNFQPGYQFPEGFQLHKWLIETYNKFNPSDATRINATLAQPNNISNYPPQAAIPNVTASRRENRSEKNNPTQTISNTTSTQPENRSNRPAQAETPSGRKNRSEKKNTKPPRNKRAKVTTDNAQEEVVASGTLNPASFFANNPLAPNPLFQFLNDTSSFRNLLEQESQGNDEPPLHQRSSNNRGVS